MGINLPDLLPFGFKQINTGLSYNDDQADLLPDALSKVNYNSVALTNHLREKLQADRTYYVAPSGDDLLNDGLTSISSFQSITKAVQVIYGLLDLNGHTVTISLGDGAYTETLTFDGVPIGTFGTDFPITLQGNPTNSSSVYIETPGFVNGEACLSLINNARIHVKNVRLGAANAASNGKRYAIKANNSRVFIENVEFSTLPSEGVHVLCENSFAFFRGSILITGNAKSFVMLRLNSIALSSNSFFQGSVTNSAQFTYFLDVQGGSSVLWNGAAFSGSAIGTAFIKDTISSIDLISYPSGLLEGEFIEFYVPGTVLVDKAAEFKDGVIIQGLLQVFDSTALHAYLAVDGDAAFAKKVDIGGDVSCYKNFSVTANTTLNHVEAQSLVVYSAEAETLSVTGLSTLAEVNVVGSANFNGIVTFTNDVFFTGNLNLPTASVTKDSLSAPGGFDKDVLEQFNGELRWTNRLSLVENSLPTLAPRDSPQLIGVPTTPTALVDTSNDQIASTAFVQAVVYKTRLELEATIAARLPIGSIVIWHGDVSTIPVGFAVCNGDNGTPDLRDKFILGGGPQQGMNYCIGEIGGAPIITVPLELYITSEEVVRPGEMYAVGHALTLDEMPPHRHADQPFLLYNGGNEYAINFPDGDGGKKSDEGGSNSYYVSRVLNSPTGSGAVHGHSLAGVSEPHSHKVVIPAYDIDIMPPYSVRAFIMRVL